MDIKQTSGKNLKKLTFEGKGLPLNVNLSVSYIDETDQESLLVYSKPTIYRDQKFDEQITRIPFVFHLQQSLIVKLINEMKKPIAMQTIPLPKIIQESKDSCFSFAIGPNECTIHLRFIIEEEDEGFLTFDCIYSNTHPFNEQIEASFDFRTLHKTNDPTLSQKASMKGTIRPNFTQKIKGSFEFIKKPSINFLSVQGIGQKTGFVSLFCGIKTQLFEEQIVSFDDVALRSGDEYNHEIKRKVGNDAIGNLLFNNIQFLKYSNFLEYLEFGMEISLGIAIDFTASNMDPSHPKSLHYQTPDSPSLYEKALLDVSKILLNYDSDKEVPLWGFGGKYMGSNPAVFNMKGRNGGEAKGTTEIQEVYRQVLSQVQLSGPTNFSPVFVEMFNYMKNKSNNFKRKNNYFVLTILTDGQITDQTETIDAIVEASYSMPLSVVIIGIGKGPFGLMETLDSDDTKLVSSKGKPMKKDIVQFARYDPNESKELFQMKVLEEIPRQISMYYALEKITPMDLDKFRGRNSF